MEVLNQVALAKEGFQGGNWSAGSTSSTAADGRCSFHGDAVAWRTHASRGVLQSPSS